MLEKHDINGGLLI